ncbi:MAG: sn-glycerol-1-phosphate dehydrogenase [Spirochaetota bacterium]
MAKAKDTEILIVKDGALDLVPGVFRSLWPQGWRPLVIADRNTWAVAGPALQAGLEAAGLDPVEAFLIPGQRSAQGEAEAEVYADDHSVARVRALLEGNDLIGIALGSGTINDVAKRASFECGKRYLSIPTAPSVDGYTSFGASITVGGFKRTLPCPAPVAVVADSIILREAPYPMIASGYGDLAAKVTAGADWLIADALGVQAVDREVWSMVQDNLRKELAAPAKVASRDPLAVEGIFSGLVATGLAMQQLQDSRPASGADHLFSHAWEMGRLATHRPHASHGFMVALGSLVSTAMMTEMLKLDARDLRGFFEGAPWLAWEGREAQLSSFFGESPGLEESLEICRQKHREGPVLAQRRAAILDGWDRVRTAVERQILPFAVLRSMFQTVGAPVEAADIDLTLEEFRRGIHLAQLIRTRYTVLDYLYEIGALDSVISTIMDGRSYFSRFAQ